MKNLLLNVTRKQTIEPFVLALGDIYSKITFFSWNNVDSINNKGKYPLSLPWQAFFTAAPTILSFMLWTYLQDTWTNLICLRNHCHLTFTSEENYMEITTSHLSKPDEIASSILTNENLIQMISWASKIRVPFIAISLHILLREQLFGCFKELSPSTHKFAEFEHANPSYCL